MPFFTPYYCMVTHTVSIIQLPSMSSSSLSISSSSSSSSLSSTSSPSSSSTSSPSSSSTSSPSSSSKGASYRTQWDKTETQNQCTCSQCSCCTSHMLLFNNSTHLSLEPYYKPLLVCIQFHTLKMDTWDCLIFASSVSEVPIRALSSSGMAAPSLWAWLPASSM